MSQDAPEGAVAAESQPHPGARHASYVPHDLKYDARFEDSLMQHILEPVNQTAGLRIIPDDSTEDPFPPDSIRLSEATSRLVSIDQDELPLQLSDPRRVFASAVDGIKLTHPSGFFEGGPGLDPDIDTFSHDFLSKHPGISTPEQLQQAIDQDTKSSIQALHERMRARQAAKANNEAIERQLKALHDQHTMELKIQRRMLEEHEAKKEAKDRKRKEREAR